MVELQNKYKIGVRGFGLINWVGAFNLYLKEVCSSEKGVNFVSHDFPINNETMANDLLHPGKLYYELWAQKISNRLLKIFEKN